MKNKHKLTNEQWFNKVIEMSNDGAYYFWPNEQETYIIKGGKIVGSASAIKKIMNCTTKKFHSKLEMSN
jgi:hypothetical protein